MQSRSAVMDFDTNEVRYNEEGGAVVVPFKTYDKKGGATVAAVRMARRTQLDKYKRFNKKLNAVANKATCFMFDPLQNERKYTIIEKSACTLIEVILEMEGLVMYENVNWCTQQDSSSCGV
ncbi:hypothetical protein PHMEG_00012642 [Phytophthora megakarya]|uniref:Uncharacterized protein n=1 Tax=Phytophthora megakarya TaxID=4795 RepID=A0A225W9W6_9STRA|nr:hypothetical protein PHMEG_00012642 [Phytophthora megakarya]